MELTFIYRKLKKRGGKARILASTDVLLLSFSAPDCRHIFGQALP